MTLSAKLSERFGMGSEGDVLTVLKNTAFKGNATDAQMTALLVVAQQYELNPFTKEIYAFPDSQNGIVPVVGVDGWARIINSNPQFDGMDFDQDDESCTCVIYRKDRSHPIKVTEYMSECKREVKPWKSHPKRMLRHKAMIQCARLAFGFGGIYDQDEAERIVEATAPVKDMGKAVIDTTDLRDKWMSEIALAESEEALTQIWSNGLAEIKPTNDMNLYSDFKQAVIDKKSQLVQELNEEGEKQ